MNKQQLTNNNEQTTINHQPTTINNQQLSIKSKVNLQCYGDNGYVPTNLEADKEESKLRKIRRGMGSGGENLRPTKKLSH